MKYLGKLFTLADRQSEQQQQQQQQPNQNFNHNNHQQQNLNQQSQQPKYTKRTNNQRSFSLTLASALYSVTFVPPPPPPPDSSRKQQQQQPLELSAAYSRNNNQSRIALLAHGEPIRQKHKPNTTHSQSVVGTKTTTTRLGESGLAGYLLTATIGKTIATTSAFTSAGATAASNEVDVDETSRDVGAEAEISIEQEEEVEVGEEESRREEEYDGDWILVDSSPPSSSSITSRRKLRRQVIEPKTTSDDTTTTITTLASTVADRKPTRKQVELLAQTLQQMTMDTTDIELIKVSWIPVRKDPVASGVLLFKGLFTKFPQYLKFFPQFAELDLECMQEDKRLLRHATKVIETVTFVVDSVGDASKSNLLNEALVNLVRQHLKRRVGLAEFRNLGIVLIDFICDVNNRRGAPSLTSHRASDKGGQSNKSSTSDSSNHSSYDSETMTSALDKIRASSSPSSSSEEDGYLGGGGGASGGGGSGGIGGRSEQTSASASHHHHHHHHQDRHEISRMSNSSRDKEQGNASSSEANCNNEAKIDTNLLVAAWTKLYSSILDLVKREEGHSSD